MSQPDVDLHAALESLLGPIDWANVQALTAIEPADADDYVSDREAEWLQRAADDRTERVFR